MRQFVLISPYVMFPIMKHAKTREAMACEVRIERLVKAISDKYCDAPTTRRVFNRRRIDPNAGAPLLHFL